MMHFRKSSVSGEHCGISLATLKLNQPSLMKNDTGFPKMGGSTFIHCTIKKTSMFASITRRYAKPTCQLQSITSRSYVNNVLIMGAAGRDFHNFNTYFRDNSDYNVVAFTATQIPGIEGRQYPAQFSGRMYPEGIPIYPEEDLETLCKSKNVDVVVFAYSDVSHEYVMHTASRVKFFFLLFNISLVK